MGKFKGKIEFIVERIDRYNGRIRYYQGNKRIGTLKQFEQSKNLYYLMAPAYGNVGDEAIVEASLAFFEDMFPEFTVITVDYLDTIQMLKEIQRIIKDTDLIFLQGGGNIGTLYYDAEIMREFIIKKFPRTKIISMPQSMYFSPSSKGKKRLNQCKKVFNAHSNLTVVARDKYTYRNMRTEFLNCRVLLSPDIVFYYSSRIYFDISITRQGIMTCLRVDTEDVLGDKRYDLINELYAKFDNLVISDTCVPRSIPSVVRKSEVDSLINQFKKVEVVITDRLHGMVIAALTDTPCVVLPSFDKKVIGTYEWIRDVEFVWLMDRYDVNELIDRVEKMRNTNYTPINWDGFRKKYFENFRKKLEV